MTVPVEEESQRGKKEAPRSQAQKEIGDKVVKGMRVPCPCELRVHKVNKVFLYDLFKEKSPSERAEV